MLVFKERGGGGGGETGVPGEIRLEVKERTYNKLNPPTHLWRRRQDWNLGHIGGRRVLSPPCHPCRPRPHPPPPTTTVLTILVKRLSGLHMKCSMMWHLLHMLCMSCFLNDFHKNCSFIYESCASSSGQCFVFHTKVR